MKTIAITGASGFVGTNLTRYFGNLNYKIIPISRDILNNEQKLKTVLEDSSAITTKTSQLLSTKLTKKKTFIGFLHTTLCLTIFLTL
jgi:NAD dependent epimerase/dehydratase family enzyme